MSLYSLFAVTKMQGYGVYWSPVLQKAKQNFRSIRTLSYTVSTEML